MCARACVCVHRRRRHDDGDGAYGIFPSVPSDNTPTLLGLPPPPPRAGCHELHDYCHRRGLPPHSSSVDPSLLCLLASSAPVRQKTKRLFFFVFPFRFRCRLLRGYIIIYFNFFYRFRLRSFFRRSFHRPSAAVVMFFFATV